MIGVLVSGEGTNLQALIDAGLPIGAVASNHPGVTALARAVVQRAGEIATVERSPGKRQGKVYVDFLQNGHGKLLAAPYCVRPLPGAPVSAPLEWKEVNAKLDVRNFTIRTMATRLDRMRRDPLRAVLDLKPDLVAALGELQMKTTNV